VVRALDGRGKATLLTDGLMTHWKLRTPEELLMRVYHQAGTAEIARLSSLVFETARSKKDAVARQIIYRAAHELALAALTVGGALDFPGGDLPLALGGGLLLFEANYREQAVRYIRRHQPVHSVTLATDPALSAARAMRELAQ
jgi:N-acetylglucosamine kinase-like BadF-type ATPase